MRIIIAKIKTKKENTEKEGVSNLLSDTVCGMQLTLILLLITVSNSLCAISLNPSADVESVMNSIVSLLLILETDKQEALIESLCEKLVKFREGERPSLRMQLWVILLFTAVPVFIVIHESVTGQKFTALMHEKLTRSLFWCWWVSKSKISDLVVNVKMSQNQCLVRSCIHISFAHYFSAEHVWLSV